MQFSNMSLASLVMVLLSVSATASSVHARTDSSGMTVGEAAQQCGNDQTISCCNTSTDNSGSGLSALDGVLGGSCTAIPISGQFSCIRDPKIASNMSQQLLALRLLSARRAQATKQHAAPATRV
jgi:hypothetical protein